MCECISKTTSDARIIRYEDLATNPIGSKEAFCKWLNISGRDDISNQYEPLPGTPSEDWKVHSTNKVHQKSIDRWRDYSGKNSWLLDFYKEYMPAKKLMKDFGYISAPRQKSVRGVISYSIEIYILYNDRPHKITMLHKKKIVRILEKTYPARLRSAPPTIASSP